ncbi:MAG TPA: iron-sulfur cluster assembly scaffold protein [Thermoanaerobaculia bacterium]|jgi:nitrogen fixation NifU-like protein|nr:iron-sulfur cluster assembly scaffold protein [Thermoanaerobaculia bacterium]
MNPYGDTIQEHFRHPRNYGSLDAPDIRHEDVNPFCGDRVRIELSIGPDDTVRASRFQGDLCVIAKAASSLLTEMITGLTLESIHDVSERQLLDALHAEIQPARRKCALLPLEVLQSGVDAYRRRTS